MGRSFTSRALVVLPAAGQQCLDESERGWLARSRLSRLEAPTEPLVQVLDQLAVTPPVDGLAALRLWGQTGQRPEGWVAAADPVYLQAGMRQLFLHPLPPSELPQNDVEETFGCLQRALGTGGADFFRVGSFGYLNSREGMPTASASSFVAAGSTPDLFLPQGTEARDHDRLQGEVQLCLHENPVNERREQAGLPPINALWFWGGGRAAEATTASLPPLYADDPLFRGYWASQGAEIFDWPQDPEAWFRNCSREAVAVWPASASPNEVADLFRCLRRGWQEKRIGRLTLLFDDGLQADLRRFDFGRLWRRDRQRLLPPAQ